MSDWNQWEQQQHHGFDQYGRPAGKRGIAERIFGPGAAKIIRSPLFATAAILLAGAGFATIIVTSFQGSGDPGNVPVIVADTTDYKTMPENRGGMSIPQEDNTIFGALDGERPFSQGAPVENLLAQSTAEEPVDKLQAFESQAAREIESEFEHLAAVSDDAMETRIEDITSVEPAAGRPAQKPQAPKEQKINIIDIPEPPAAASAQTIRQTRVVEPLAKPSQQTASKNITARPDKIYKPGASPETLAFVRSVLDKKDGKQTEQQVASARAAEKTQAQQLNNITPAAGAAVSAGNISGGSYYVQVVSVPSQAGAEQEWKRIQKAFSRELVGQGYRIQEANLGARGTYFRVQVGPFGKQKADSICASMKAQKPGSCLVVK